MLKLSFRVAAWVSLAAMAGVALNAQQAGQNRQTAVLIDGKSGTVVSNAVVPIVEPPQTSWCEKILSPLIANWPLVAVAIWGIIVAKRTLREMSQQRTVMQGQLTATQDQIKMQTAAMEQWIDVLNWRADDASQIDKLQYGDGSRRHRIRIRFDLSNNTSFPLTIIDGKIAFEWNTGHAVERCAVLLPQNHFLTPRDPHVVDIRLDASPSNLQALQEGLFTCRVNGELSYIGVLKKRQMQILIGMAQFGPSIGRFYPEIPLRPSEEHRAQEQETN